MKKFVTFGKQFLCVVLVACMLILTACTGKEQYNDDKRYAQSQNYQEYLEQELGVKIVENEALVTYLYTQDNCEMTYNSETGDFYYTDEDGTFPLEITDVNADGIATWRIQKAGEIIEGEVNTSEAPSPQMAIAIAGTSYLVYTFVYCVFKAALIVTVAGTTCYLASAVADTIKKNANKYNYFPAYNVFGNVYVATNVGLTKAKAVSRIKKGKSVWAKNESYAISACISASPIGAVEWGWHGNRQTSSGYYPHYHAVKYYKSTGQYVHTGAHCWYL